MAQGDEAAVDLDWRTIALGALVLAAMVIGAGTIRALPRTVTSLAVAGVLALGLDPVVTAVGAKLGLRRIAAVAVVLGAVVVALTVMAVLVVPPAVRQAQDLSGQVPKVVHDMEHLPLVGDRLARAGFGNKVDEFIRQLPARLSGRNTPLARIGRSVAGGALMATTILLFALTLLVDGERLVRLARRVVPPGRRATADDVAGLAYKVVGKYAAGSLLVATIAGLFTLIAGLALRVPLAPLAGLWVAVWDLVPQVGGAAGGVPFVLLAATRGAGIGVIAALLFVVYLQLENNVLSPLVVGRVVKLSPLATMTAALIGVAAGGVVGALIAVPVLGAGKAIYLELRPPVTSAP